MIQRLLLIVAFSAMSVFAETPCANYNLIPNPDLVEPIALQLPGTSPWFGDTPWAPTLTVTKLPLAGLVRWQGMACDQVWLPVGSEIRTRNVWFLDNWLWTVRPDGYLNYRWAPR